jgi:hypothetical protein
VATLAICSALIGLFLGIWFRFLVLVPILFVGSASLAAIAMTQDQTLPQAISAMVVFAVPLQIGYVCTALFCSIARAPRASRAVPHPAGVVVVRKS